MLELWPVGHIGLLEYSSRLRGVLLEELLGFWAQREVRDEDVAPA
jgi:hypothetical protein